MCFIYLALITAVGAGHALGRTFTLKQGKSDDLYLDAKGIFDCTGITVDPYSMYTSIHAKG